MALKCETALNFAWPSSARATKKSAGHKKVLLVRSHLQDITQITLGGHTKYHPYQAPQRNVGGSQLLSLIFGFVYTQI